MEQDTILDFVNNGGQQFLHHLSIDCVIFGYHERQLKVLLLKWKLSDKWSLPGGFIKLDETLEAAAARILTERTGLSQLFFQQFHTFGAPQRSVRTAADIEHLENLEHRHCQRPLAVQKNGLYRVLCGGTEYSQVHPQPDYLSEECTWHDVNAIPQLVFDHNLIVAEALKALRMQIYLQPIGYNLLPKKFTLPEIHDLYETVLDKQLDRSKFP